MKEKKKIHLTVQTLSGKYQHPFDADTTLQAVVEATWKHLEITPAQGEVWELRYNETVLNLSLTIETAGLPDKATLMLAAKDGGGGGGRNG
jgi:hypothetical protein